METVAKGLGFASTASKAVGTGVVAGGVTATATVENIDVDFDVLEMSGAVEAEGKIWGKLEGDEQLDEDPGRYDVNTDVLGGEYGNVEAAIDVGLDGSWKMYVGLDAEEAGYDEESCDPEKVVNDTLSGYGVEEVSQNKSYGTDEIPETYRVVKKNSTKRADGIGDMLEEGAENGSAC